MWRDNSYLYVERGPLLCVSMELRLATALLFALAGCAKAFVTQPLAVGGYLGGRSSHLARTNRAARGPLQMAVPELAAGEDFDSEVLENSKGSSTPALVDFYATWCAPCKLIEPNIQKLAANYEGKLKVIKVDTDKHKPLVKRYRIRGLPLLAIVKDGEIVDKYEGALTYDKLEEFAKRELPDLA